MASRTFIKVGLLLLVFLALPARAERPTTENLYSWLIKLGPIAFNKAGGAFLPTSVLQGLKGGSVSPIMQFVLVNNLTAKCTESVLKMTPGIRDPYIVAKAKFEYGLCRQKKCFQQGMLIMVLPQMSSRYGGDEQDRAGAQQQALMLAQAFKKDPACDGSGNTGMDPVLLSLIAQ